MLTCSPLIKNHITIEWGKHAQPAVAFANSNITKIIEIHMVEKIPSPSACTTKCA